MDTSWRRQLIAPLIFLAFITAVGLGANALGAATATGVRAAAGLLVAAVVLVGARRHRAVPRSAWSLIALGIGVWVAADTIWDGLEASGTPEDSAWFGLPHALYLLVYVLLIVAIALLVNARGDRRTFDNVVDGAVLAIGVVVLLRMFVVDTATPATVDGVLSAAYPFADALLLAGVAWLMASSRGRNGAAWLLGLGLVAVFGADAIWELVRHSESVFWLDPMYTIAYACFAAAALHPSVSVVHVAPPDPPAWERQARFASLVGALFVVLGVVLWGERDDSLTQICAAVLIGAIAVRLAVLARAVDRAHREAAASERRFRQLATTVPVAVYELTPELTIGFANAAGTTMAGRDILGGGADELIAGMVDPRDHELVQETMQRVLRGDRGDAHFRMLEVDGTNRWLAMNSTPLGVAGDAFAGCVVSVMDITALKDVEALLELQAHHDPLTGLPNRRLLFDRLSGALSRIGRRPGSVAVVFLDLDRFKAVNDSLGHEAGDELLKVVAGRILDTIRQADTAARLGGDEFVVVLEGISDPAHAGAIADKLIAAISEPVQLAAGVAQVGSSVGIALTDDPTMDPNHLLRAADDAMYVSKASGRGGYRIAS